MNEKHNSSVGWKWMHAIPVSEVKILQTPLSQERWGMMLSSKLRTSFLYKSRSAWCWFYLRVDYPLTDENLYGRAQGLLVLMVSQSICLQTWWIFFRGWLHAPLCGKRKITLWWCELIWTYESIRLLLRQTFSCDSGQSLQTHLQPARPLHLPSLKLSINTEEYPRIWLPHINRCTTTQTHSQTQT